MRILLVEEDETMIRTLQKGLENQHYVVDVVKTGEAGWCYGSTFEYGLIMLNVNLPELDGICLCQRLRAEGCTTPILLLTAQTTSALNIQGLDAGADDYVVKPFDMAELNARIRALLRRGKTNASPILTWGNLLLNPSTCEVAYNGQPLTLTAKEYELLELLLRDSQHVFSIDEILDSLWSSEEFPAEATVRSHIRRLRQKLTAAGVPDLIATVHGRGYYLKSSTPTEEVPVRRAIDPKPALALPRPQPASLLLIVDDDPEFTQPLINQAALWGLRTAIAPTAEAACAWFAPPTLSEVDVVLLRMTDPDPSQTTKTTTEFKHQKTFLQTVVQHPSLSLLAVGHPKWATALQLNSSKQRWLEPSASVEQLLITITELLKIQQNHYSLSPLGYAV